MSARLGDILVARGLVSREALDGAVGRQQECGEYIGTVLVERGLIEEKALLAVLAELTGLPVLDLPHLRIPAEVIGRIPAKFAWHHRIMPVELAQTTLTIAVANPYDPWPVDDLETHFGLRVSKALASAADIRDAIERHYGVAADAIERIMDEEPEAPAANAAFLPAGATEDLEKTADSASVIRVVNDVINQAIAERATDIHLENFGDEARLRYRVDGVLRDARISTDLRFLYPAIVSRIKIMSGLDIIERRIPQDGRAKVKVGPREYDLRISAIPTIHGENIVIRILPTTLLLSLGDLGMVAEDLARIDRLIRCPNGILFVTGPTGSGKSTTLYASLKKLNLPGGKLVTIEDPVEYALKGVSQVQVNPKIGLSFARALRHMLRHDPDVIMVGEIRDQETASIAIRAALTGHLVLSTLHTNDAAGAVTRLLDIGVEPYLVASSARAFVAQRLVRVLCPACRVPCALDAEAAAEFGLAPADAPPVYRAKGCERCAHSGFKGRTGLYEILMVTAPIRELIVQRAPADQIKHRAVELGMRTLLKDGFEKVARGITTAEEVLQVARDQE